MAEKHLTDGTTALAAQPRVIKIEAAEKPQNVQLRVAAYTRVSSDSDDQLNSFAAQNRYYAELISGKAEWRMVDIYADEGITGTSLEKRDGCKRMLADCRAGKINRVLVKSVSRFARNALELLETTRELKDLGVVVVFEEQDIDTSQMLSEMQLTLLAMAAQEESTSISKNMRWSLQKRMESGAYTGCTAPYGYRLENGKLVVVPEEGAIVQRIFKMHLEGMGQHSIVKELNRQGIPTREGGPWHISGIHYILSNEKYIGDSVVQKKFTSNPLT